MVSLNFTSWNQLCVWLHAEDGLRRPLLAPGEVRPAPDPVPGFRVKVLDGNHLGKTERRLKVPRDVAAGPLPDGPTTPSSPTPTVRAASSPTRRSRPKK